MNMSELEGISVPAIPSLEKKNELEQTNTVVENIDRMMDLARNGVFETALWDPYQKPKTPSLWINGTWMIPRGIEGLQQKIGGTTLTTLEGLNKLVELRQLALKNYDFEQKFVREENEKQEDLLNKIYFWAEFAVEEIKNHHLEHFNLESAEPELLKEYVRACQFIIEFGTHHHPSTAKKTYEKIETILPELRKLIKNSGVKSLFPELEKLEKSIQELLKSLEMTNVINKEIIGEKLSPEDQKMIEEWKQRYGETYDVLFARASNHSDVFRNIVEIKDLEKIKSGISQRLYTEIGIVNFDRTGRLGKPNRTASLKLLASTDVTSEPTHENMSEGELTRISEYVDALLRAGSWDTIKKMALYLAANKKNLERSINQLTAESRRIFEETLNERSVITALEHRMRIYVDEKDEKEKTYAVSDFCIKKCSEILKTLLGHLNIDFEPLVKSWSSHQTKPIEMGKNISAMEEIEKSRPGAIRTLMKEFGIRNFARYPLEVLIRQYDQRENRSLPYGVILNPTDDYNGAFLSDMDLWRKLAGDLVRQGYTLRVLEAESKTEIGRHLLKLDKRYGTDQKISFAIIGGHGTKDKICFGGYDDRHNLTTEDLKGYGAKRSKHFLVPHPQIILASCSTGLSEGIGEKLSDVLGATVSAPNQPTTIESIEVTSEGDQLGFKVKYTDKDSGQTYTKGRAGK